MRTPSQVDRWCEIVAAERTDRATAARWDV
jgi:hypothetical protein